MPKRQPWKGANVAGAQAEPKAEAKPKAKAKTQPKGKAKTQPKQPKAKAKGEAKGDTTPAIKRTCNEAKLGDEGSRMNWRVRFPDGRSKAFKFDTHNREAKRQEAIEYMNKEGNKGATVVR